VAGPAPELGRLVGVAGIGRGADRIGFKEVLPAVESGVEDAHSGHAAAQLFPIMFEGKAGADGEGV
jgi:hypothetical protein